jgi:hypothetical protein
MEKENNPFFQNSENFVVTLFRHRKALFIISVVAAILSSGVALLLPVKYKASVILFSAQNNNISRALLEEQAYESKDYLAFGDDKNCEQMMQLLKSDDVMYALAKKYDLFNYYGLTKDWHKNATLKDYYSENFQFDQTEYQSIKITVYDESPPKDSALAAGIADIADSIYKQIILKRAKAALEIVKHQYDSACIVLKKLNDSMNFYRKEGILSYDLQVKELTKGYADAQTKGSATEAKLMEDKLNNFAIFGSGYWDLFNDLQDQYKWMLQVKQGYLEAKANMDKVVPPFFVAEHAIKPERRSLPVRWIVVFISTLAAFFFGLVFLLITPRVKVVMSKLKQMDKPSQQLNR